MALPTTVGVLSIGQMGAGIARLLLAHDFHVVTNVSDRSIATRDRAESAGIECVSSDLELVARSDCTQPPEAASRTYPNPSLVSCVTSVS